MLVKSRSNVDLSFASTVASTTKSRFSLVDDCALEDWMYWQRDTKNNKCWTKVYAVLENEFLWIFQGAKSRKTLLVQIAVASVEESGDRQLRMVDPNGEEVEIALYDRQTFLIWKMRLQEAAALTAEYFRAFAIDAKDLSRRSQYRGSLVSYRRDRKRSKCKQAVRRWLGHLTKRWSRSSSASTTY